MLFQSMLQFFCFRFSLAEGFGLPVLEADSLLQLFCFRFRFIWWEYDRDSRDTNKLQFFCFRFICKQEVSTEMTIKLIELQFFCFRFRFLNLAGIPGCSGGSFNSSVLDSELWFYLPLFKFFPAPFTGSRQRVYPPLMLTTR